MNHSATICVAALIHLEDLAAEAALERVLQARPWAHPDGAFFGILDMPPDTRWRDSAHKHIM
jgi:hypothetical protein